MTKFNSNAIAAAVREYTESDTRTERAKKAFETAAQTRERAVIKFADTVRGMGFTSCDVFRTSKAGKGEHHDAITEQLAACILSKAELAAFASDQAAFKLGGKDGKTRIYSAKHKASTKVKNMLKRLLDAADPYVTGEKAPNAEGTPKGAKANGKKDLDVFLTEQMAAMLKRVLNDAKAPAPTGKNHEEIRKVLKTANAELVKLIK